MLAEAQCCLDILRAEQAKLATLVLVENDERSPPRAEPLSDEVASEHSAWVLDAKGYSATAVPNKARMLRKRKARDSDFVDDLPEG